MLEAFSIHVFTCMFCSSTKFKFVFLFHLTFELPSFILYSCFTRKQNHHYLRANLPPPEYNLSLCESDFFKCVFLTTFQTKKIIIYHVNLIFLIAHFFQHLFLFWSDQRSQTTAEFFFLRLIFKIYLLKLNI